VCFCAKQVDGLTASRQILTSKKDSIKPPICKSKVFPEDNIETASGDDYWLLLANHCFWLSGNSQSDWPCNHLHVLFINRNLKLAVQSLIRQCLRSQSELLMLICFYLYFYTYIHYKMYAYCVIQLGCMNCNIT
jgi:hypothetical protein